MPVATKARKPKPPVDLSGFEDDPEAPPLPGPMLSISDACYIAADWWGEQVLHRGRERGVPDIDRKVINFRAELSDYLHEMLSIKHRAMQPLEFCIVSATNPGHALSTCLEKAGFTDNIRKASDWCFLVPRYHYMTVTPDAVTLEIMDFSTDGPASTVTQEIWRDE